MNEMKFGKSDASGRHLNIGLHSQTLQRRDGIVAGSEITTLGLKNALERRAEVNRVIHYAPGHDSSPVSDNLDMLIIEGWDDAVPVFIQNVRAHHPHCRIFFWNLSLMGIEKIVRLDVDGFFCNSKKIQPYLETYAPARFLMLAADTNGYEPVQPEQKYSHAVTFLGMFHPCKSAALLQRILYEAADYGLAIYGNGWERHPYLKKYWLGLLPCGDITRLYSSARVVLGLTEDRQRSAGMINNRVFEALSCGACFISEYFKELENVFGDTILYSRKKGDTSRYLEKLLNDDALRRATGARGRDLVLKHHTYNHRVEQIMEFYRFFTN